MSREFPTFLIVGAAKSGTTSLWKALGRHPGVFASKTKEIHFFDEDSNWERGEKWYRSFFEGNRSLAAAGEATPTYLSTPTAPARMAATVPDARLVAILRDPVKRAYSQYFHMRYYGWENRSFAQAAAEELRSRNWDLAPHYLAMGRYAMQLEHLAEHFSREQIRVVLLDEFRTDPSSTLRQVLGHIGVDPSVVPEADAAENSFREVRFEPLARRLRASSLVQRLSPRGWELMVRMFTRTGGAPPPMEPQTKQTLYRAFAEENERLAAWLGRDLSAWKAS